MDLNSYWFPFVYQYIIGGLFFFLGLYIAVKKNVLTLSNMEDRKVFIQLIIGLLLYGFVHGTWIYLVGTK
jgi:hypothetical protein